MTGFTCATCGEHHDRLPLTFGPDAPALWHAIPEDERARRGELTTDLCVIDDEFYFVRGRIEIRVHDSDDVFCWLVWASLSQANFRRTHELWETPGREAEPPYFGWLCSSLPCYAEPTLHLKTHVHTRTVGQRQLIELEPTDHPLAIEQRNGMSRARVRQIAEYVMHGTD